jgi:hypothetical protein
MEYTFQEESEILKFFAVRLNKFEKDVSVSDTGGQTACHEDHPAMYHQGTAYYKCGDQIMSTHLGLDEFIYEEEKSDADPDYYIAMQDFLSRFFEVAL